MRQNITSPDYCQRNFSYNPLALSHAPRTTGRSDARLPSRKVFLTLGRPQVDLRLRSFFEFRRIVTRYAIADLAFDLILIPRSQATQPGHWFSRMIAGCYDSPPGPLNLHRHVHIHDTLTMAKKKRRPPPISSLPRIQQRNLHNALSLSLIRGISVHGLSESLAEHADTRGLASVKAIARVDATPALRGLQAVWLFFASAEVAMELWDARGFSDPEINDMMNNPEKRRLLRDFRNVVFHPGPIDDARIEAFYNAWEEVEDWALPILDKMIEYTRAWFIDYARSLR